MEEIATHTWVEQGHLVRWARLIFFRHLVLQSRSSSGFEDLAHQHLRSPGLSLGLAVAFHAPLPCSAQALLFRSS